MFYYIVSKIPLIAGITDDTKLFKIFVIGTICYIILHAFLFSSIGEQIEIIQKYRNYMYYLWAADLLVTGGLNKFNEPKPEISDNDNKFIDSDSEDSDSDVSDDTISPSLKQRQLAMIRQQKEQQQLQQTQQTQQTQQSQQKLTREEILRNLEQTRQQSFPFIRKEESVESNKNKKNSPPNTPTKTNTQAAQTKPTVNETKADETKANEPKDATSEKNQLIVETELPVYE